MAGTQPTLPAPEPLTELEGAYIEDQPSGLFPENQDSNFGFYRRQFTNTLQDVANQLGSLYNERFPDTSTQYLKYWEEEVGLPQMPAGLSVIQRQALVSQRLKKGYFSRSRRNKIIEDAISATFGAAATFGTSGLVLGVGGVPLHSGLTSAAGYYKVIEDIPNFQYFVYIDSRVSVDMVSLLRELSRATPGGLRLTILTWYQKSGGGISALKTGAIPDYVIGSVTYYPKSGGAKAVGVTGGHH